MSRFVENAAKLMDAAESSLRAGHSPSDMSILISADGAIRMVAGSDWPLESLQAHHGARTAYRISNLDQRVRIEGREANRTCRFEAAEPARVTRLLFGGLANYTLPVPAFALSSAETTSAA